MLEKSNDMDINMAYLTNKYFHYRKRRMTNNCWIESLQSYLQARLQAISFFINFVSHTFNLMSYIS